MILNEELIKNLLGDEKNETSERRVLVWKFNKLDMDQDGSISYDEIKSELRNVIMIMKPITCSKKFYKHCDKNADKMIDLEEWIKCLKIDFSGELKLLF